MNFSTTRTIGIDAGHRVTNHGSKCKNVHGHRYKIEATVIGALHAEGEQQGMVLDFGFLKELMMQEIDVPCDHGLILWSEDPLVRLWCTEYFIMSTRWQLVHVENIGKIYLMDSVPTAENLARHWFDRLAGCVLTKSKGLGRLKRVTVWETPYCVASYPEE